MSIENHLNQIISGLYEKGSIDVNKISNGVHTYRELYDYCVGFFGIICNMNREVSWKSKVHSNGTIKDGYFIVGTETAEGQVTFECELCYWDSFDVIELEMAPKCGSDNSKQAIKALNKVKAVI